MNRLFGRGKAKEPDGVMGDAIAKVDQRADSIEAKITKLDAEVKDYKFKMTRMREGPGKNALKEKASRVLKQKKMYQKQVENMRQQSLNMEQVNYSTQMLKDTQATVKALQTGVNEMKKAYKKTSIDQIEHTQDDLEDMKNFAAEAQEALGHNFGFGDDIDEDELNAELDAYGDEMIDDQDSSYLDSIAPRAPDREPGAGSVNIGGLSANEFRLPTRS